MNGHQLSGAIRRMLSFEDSLLRFFTESAWSTHDPTDPERADFVAGNPQELVQPAFADSIQRWAVPQDEHWYAYKFNEPYAQEAAASGLRERRGVPFEAAGAVVEMPGRFRISLTGNDEMVDRALPIFEAASRGA
jgi:hypothetical protein